MVLDPTRRILILPPTPGACALCGDVHAPGEPHNRDSLAYQHHFRRANGRYPTWEDAMSHCSGRVRAAWRVRLIQKGMLSEVIAGHDQ